MKRTTETLSVIHRSVDTAIQCCLLQKFFLEAGWKVMSILLLPDGRYDVFFVGKRYFNWNLPQEAYNSFAQTQEWPALAHTGEHLKPINSGEEPAAKETTSIFNEL